MTYLRAARLATLISIGADDATIAAEGYSDIEIAHARAQVEAGQRVRAILEQHGIKP